MTIACDINKGEHQSEYHGIVKTVQQDLAMAREYSQFGTGAW